MYSGDVKKTNIGKIKYNGKYIALEGVSNPANFGAVVRTAEAVGLDGVIVSGGCDIYNPKSQRAAMGSLFRLNIAETDDLPNTLKELAGNGMSVLAGVPDFVAADMGIDLKGVAGSGYRGKITSADLQPAAPAAAAEEVKAPPKEPCTESIPGVEVMDLEDAVKVLWKAGIYAESGMGCTGPIVMMAPANEEKSRELLKAAGYIS